MSFSYESITLNDPNPIKRRLQSRRLDDALHAWKDLPGSWTGRYLDFGAGSGALCSRVRSRFPGASVTCFEPSISNRTEAARVLDGQGIELIDDDAQLSGTYDLITCCEVFEHLPEPQSAAALDHIRTLLTPKTGMLVVGVPNELYAVGLAKGLFRMSRRYGQYDANWHNVLACAVGRPPTDRIESEFEQLPYIFAHTGFDYRWLRAQLPSHGLRVRRTYGSPLRTLPVPVNSEAYFVCTRD